MTIKEATMVAVMLSVLVGCASKEVHKGVVLSSSGRPTVIECQFEGIKEKITLSDCSVPFEQYARDYSFAMTVVGKTKAHSMHAGATSKALFSLSDNAYQLMLSQYAMCRDRNSCVYTRREYVDMKKEYDFLFTKLRNAATKLDTQIAARKQKHGPPTLGIGEEDQSFQLPNEVEEFNSASVRLLQRQQ